MRTEFGGVVKVLNTPDQKFRNAEEALAVTSFL
jgi:hypothetical protein